MLPDEIIIADDGSKKETGEFVQLYSKTSKIAIQYIWQPDEGFQLCRIRNKAIAIAKFDYIIQIDGDLILHKDFIKDHLNFKKYGFFVTGSRVMLTQKITNELLNESKPDIKKYVKKRKLYLNGMRISFLQEFFALRYKNKNQNKYTVKGCNMAFWKKDLLAVNGYDENLTGWGSEDSELAIRLIQYGIKKRFLKFGAVCYHLNHKVASREMEERNKLVMKETEKKN